MVGETMFQDLLTRLGITSTNLGVAAGGQWIDDASGGEIEALNPSTGQPLARVRTAGREGYERAVGAARESLARWARTPAPQRGEIVRQIGTALREHRRDLGLLVTLEVGKILAEGEGEVQEMIDMCDFATGLSRQLHGLTIASERPEHRMFEQWHPLGVVGIITAFNFPVAVWAWNAAIAAVCGDPCVWKPSPLAPLSAIAVQHLVHRVVRGTGYEGVFNLVLDETAQCGRWLAADERIALVSATGSCQMGESVGATVASRMGRSLLELGGNNAAIVAPSAHQELAIRGVLFAAVGTAGQRCTTLRRLILHESIANPFLDRLSAAYASLTIGNAWEEGVLVGPLIRPTAVAKMRQGLEAAARDGATILFGGETLQRPGFFVRPAIVRATPDVAVVREETFAPILYVLTYRELDEAIAIQNDVRQGLSSAIFTDSVAEAERFLSAGGSDCGIANVNIGTSGAEIGGSFGGEKATGGGREAGSDAWKAYMRRQTCTVNQGLSLPLAQGVKFDLPWNRNSPHG